VHTRSLAVVPAVILIGAAFAVPTAAPAKAASVEFAFPEQGGVGFNHAVVKAKKKGKAIRGKRAKRVKRKATKLGKGASATLKLRPAQTPDPVQIAARVAAIEGSKNRYGIDVAVAHAGPGAQPVRADAAGIAPGGGPVNLEVELFLREGGSRDLLNAKVATILSTPDADVTGSDPNRDEQCAEFVNYGRRQLLGRRGPLLTNIKATLSVLDLGQRSFCDQPIPSALDSLYTRLALGQPPTCTPNLSAAPAPNPAGEIVIRIFCRQPATSIGFEIPGKRLVQAFVPPANLPNCQQATNNLSGNKTLFCFGGTLPANTINVLKVRPDRPLACDDKVRTYFNPLGNQTSPIQDTSAFATCP